MKVFSQNHWPSLEYDFWAVLSFFTQFFLQVFITKHLSNLDLLGSTFMSQSLG